MSDLDGLEAACWMGRDRHGHRPRAGVLHQARLPGVRHVYAELDPRLFSNNSKHGWCPDCVGTGVAS